MKFRLQITFHTSRHSSKCHFSMRSMLLIFTGKASRRSITKCCFCQCACESLTALLWYQIVIFLTMTNDCHLSAWRKTHQTLIYWYLCGLFMSLNPLKKILKAAAGCNIIYKKGKMILQEWWWFLNRLSIQKLYICAGVCILGRYYIGVHFWHGDYVNDNDVTFSITNGPDGAQV